MKPEKLEASLNKIDDQKTKDEVKAQLNSAAKNFAAGISPLVHNAEKKSYCQWVCMMLEKGMPESQIMFASQGFELHDHSYDDCPKCKDIILSKLGELIAKQSGASVTIKDLSDDVSFGIANVNKNRRQ